MFGPSFSLCGLPIPTAWPLFTCVGSLWVVKLNVNYHPRQHGFLFMNIFQDLLYLPVDPSSENKGLAQFWGVTFSPDCLEFSPQVHSLVCASSRIPYVCRQSSI